MAFFTVRKIVLRKFKVWPEQKSVKTSHSTTSMKSTNFNQKKNCSIDVYFIKFWSTSFWWNDNFEEHFHLSSNQIKKYNFKLYLILIKYFPICPNWKDFYDNLMSVIWKQCCIIRQVKLSLFTTWSGLDIIIKLKWNWTFSRSGLPPTMLHWYLEGSTEIK